jgi:excisionase family DNA binding protein
VAHAIRPAEEATRAEASRLLAALGRTKHPKISLPSGEEAELPESVATAMMQALEAIAIGQQVTIVVGDRDLTTTQAAEILGVSRQYLVRLLDDEVIPSYLVGSHRRLRVDDVMIFKARRDEKRRGVLRQMVREAHAAGLYD